MTDSIITLMRQALEVLERIPEDAQPVIHVPADKFREAVAVGMLVAGQDGRYSFADPMPEAGKALAKRWRNEAVRALQKARELPAE